jgi:hypothetical protein
MTTLTWREIEAGLDSGDAKLFARVLREAPSYLHPYLVREIAEMLNPKDGGEPTAEILPAQILEQSQ